MVDQFIGFLAGVFLLLVFQSFFFELFIFHSPPEPSLLLIRLKVFCSCVVTEGAVGGHSCNYLAFFLFFVIHGKAFAALSKKDLYRDINFGTIYFL